ncbi:MAG: MBL fold metallo-hydrolase [Gammaproteobacteria bacterium]|nr:MBL fold metallo-hydrolase [Gammaproteobacteria bacterium]
MPAALPATVDYAHGITCIDTEQVRPGQACCYLIGSGQRSGTAQYAFVDCGTSLSVPGIKAVLAARGIGLDQIAYVMPTHVHLDHAGGAGLLMRECGHAKLVVHPRGAKHLIDPAALIAGATAVYGPKQMAAMYGEIVPIDASRVIVADDGYRLDFDGRELLFIDAPGHARHHYAIWDEQSRGWFAGDTFGLSYRVFDGPNGATLLPTTTPVQFEPDAWLQTIDRFMAADPDWMYLTHYGRVGNVQQLAADLRGDLAMYQSIALHLADAPDRHARIVEALTLHALEELAAMAAPVSDDTARDWLAFDLELNAQGLGVWLDRQKLKAAA